MSSSDRSIINSDCIVIGGDITGLIIANILQRRGIEVTVLNENKEIGRRLATCCISQGESIAGVFDYGTQYFSVNSPEFQVWLDDWLEHGVVKQWGQGFGEANGKPCYCGIDGNCKIPQYLAKNLAVYTDTMVAEVSYEKKWLVTTRGDRQYQGDMLVMTSPVPQSLSLLDASLVALPLEIRFSLEQIEYDSCIAVLVLLERT